MTYAQIYAESLRLMFATGTDNIEPTAKGLAVLTMDTNYKDYLFALPGSINRCLADIESKDILPWQSCNPKVDSGTDTSDYKAFPISTLCANAKQVERVMVVCGGRERLAWPGEDYRVVDATIHLRTGQEYIIYYSPSLPRITDHTDLDNELMLPDTVAIWIPYFIKSELYRSEDPGEAAEARNLYEQQIAQILPPATQHAASVTMLYNFGDVIW